MSDEYYSGKNIDDFEHFLTIASIVGGIIIGALLAYWTFWVNGGIIK